MMNADQERTIVKNIIRLVKLTRNLPKLVSELENATILTAEERDRIFNCNDEESSSSLLYETVMRKPPSSFNVLLRCLRSSQNERLAAVLEGSSIEVDTVTNGKANRMRRQSSTERYLKDDSSTTISGSEMGISELLEEYAAIREDWPKLYHKFNLIRAEKNLDYYSSYSNFIVRFTVMLRDWVEIHKKKASLDNLCRLLENEGYDKCSGRIRRMFEKYTNSGFEMDIAGGNPIVGKEVRVASILECNPSFSVFPERLFLMLNGPMEGLQDVDAEQNFVKMATRMLMDWSYFNGERATLENLAALVALNGHFYTADKLVGC